MVITVKNSNTIAFPKLGNAVQRKQNQAQKHASTQLHLSSALQTTLDLQKMLQLFFNELQMLISLNSLGYRNEKYQLNHSFGKTSKHSCHYNLVINHENLGDLVFTRSKRLSEDELELIELLIGCLICPVRNALMYKDALLSALQDPLTGVGNRIALETTLAREIGLAQRHQQSLSLLIIDLDHFKSINDNFGHIAGDCVLKDTATQLNLCCRDTDAIYRFGGEEFIVILNKTDLDGAVIIAERLRTCIEESSTTHNDSVINITASVGVTSLRKEDSMNSLIERADHALYQAKKSGRNQTACPEH